MSRTIQVVVAAFILCGMAGFVLAADRVDTGVPDGLKGFAGILQGKIVVKGANGFVLDVEKVVKTWNGSKASNPDAAVGKRLEVHVPANRTHVKEALAGMQVGDSVAVGVMQKEGSDLQAVELLVKADELPALQAKWAARENSAPKNTGSDANRKLEQEVKRLRQENEELRRKLGQ